MKTLVASLSLVLAACAAAPGGGGGGAAAPKAAAAAPVTALAGTRWTGVVEGSTDARTLPRLEFTENRVSGYTGCNMMSGVWKVEKGEVRMGPLATTKRLCLGPENEVEQRVLKTVGQPESRVTREGNRLIFTAPDGARFEFQESAAS